jgi:LuxR family maltose regulon positive regulatory protein
LDAAQAARRMGSLLKILTLQAEIFLGQNKIDSALSLLEPALAIAETEGYLRTFLDHGRPMQALLRIALTQGICPNYAARLLDQFEMKSAATGGLLTPLTDRETEVLRLIVAGLSNTEIADELFIAESTVKTHINHIYAKLNVTSRAQSIAKARDQKLL